ncbi:hypothetical protein EJB05_13782, partial [Eragrostis curvula]
MAAMAALLVLTGVAEALLQEAMQGTLRKKMRCLEAAFFRVQVRDSTLVTVTTGTTVVAEGAGLGEVSVLVVPEALVSSVVAMRAAQDVEAGRLMLQFHQGGMGGPGKAVLSRLLSGAGNLRPRQWRLRIHRQQRLLRPLPMLCFPLGSRVVLMLVDNTLNMCADTVLAENDEVVVEEVLSEEEDDMYGVIANDVRRRGGHEDSDFSSHMQVGEILSFGLMENTVASNTTGDEINDAQAVAHAAADGGTYFTGQAEHQGEERVVADMVAAQGQGAMSKNEAAAERITAVVTMGAHEAADSAPPCLERDVQRGELQAAATQRVTTASSGSSTATTRTLSVAFQSPTYCLDTNKARSVSPAAAAFSPEKKRSSTAATSVRTKVSETGQNTYRWPSSATGTPSCHGAGAVGTRHEFSALDYKRSTAAATSAARPRAFDETPRQARTSTCGTSVLGHGRQRVLRRLAKRLWRRRQAGVRTTPVSEERPALVGHGYPLRPVRLPNLHRRPVAEQAGGQLVQDDGEPFAAAAIQGKTPGATKAEEEHQLKLLYTRQLQWRHANAHAAAVLSSQRKAAEMVYLEEWSSLEKVYANSLSGTAQAPNATVLRLPVSDGAMVDVKALKNDVGSAFDVMQSIGNSTNRQLSKATFFISQEKNADTVAGDASFKLGIQGESCISDVGPTDHGFLRFGLGDKRTYRETYMTTDEPVCALLSEATYKPHQNTT